MVVIPRHRPEMANLNSFYVDIQRLMEHFRGALEAGCIHFRSADARAAVYFEMDEILSAVYSAGEKEIHGAKGIDAILAAADSAHFTIDIYRLDPDEIHLWAGMNGAVPLYENLSSAFTDPAALIRKMSSEKLTGYIAVDIESRNEEGLLFFNNGQIIAGSFSWRVRRVSQPAAAKELFIQRVKTSGGVFHVGSAAQQESSQTPEPPGSGTAPDPSVLKTLEELLIILEQTVSMEKRISTPFMTLLKKKLVQKAERYEFLDPFAAEFGYENRKIVFTGDAGEKELARGIVETVLDLARELGLLGRLGPALKNWRRQYSEEIAAWGIRLKL